MARMTNGARDQLWRGPRPRR